MDYVKIYSFAAAVGITAAGMLIFAPPASGRPILVTGEIQAVSRHVGYADLNLASAAGAMTLSHRVRGAVQDLCLDATGGDDGGFDFKTNMTRCSAHAWSDARPQIERAVERAHEIAATGSSSLAAAAITISTPE